MRNAVSRPRRLGGRIRRVVIAAPVLSGVLLAGACSSAGVTGSGSVAGSSTPAVTNAATAPPTAVTGSSGGVAPTTSAASSPAAGPTSPTGPGSGDGPALPTSACSLISPAEMGALTGLGSGITDPNAGALPLSAKERLCSYLFTGDSVTVLLVSGSDATQFQAGEQVATAQYHASALDTLGVPAYSQAAATGGTSVVALDGTITISITALTPVTLTQLSDVARHEITALA